MAMINNTSIVKTEDIGKNTIIGSFCFIDENVQIGDNCVIHPNVVIYGGTVIRSGTEIFPGVFIGKEPRGAGNLTREPEFIKKILIGENCSIGPNVVIYYDVEIGNSCLIGDNAST